jgi:hypothetical protein
LAKIVCFAFVILGALAPKWLGVAWRAPNCMGCHGKFVRVGFHLHKGRDALKTKQRESILEKLESGEIFTGKGIHQETNLARPGDTRWGSHYLTLIRLETMWESILHVLAIVHEDGRITTQAAGLIEKMETFKFAFILKLMLKVLAVTNELS